MDRRRPLSIRTELLLNIALLAATALSLGVASVLVLYPVLDPPYAPVYISVLVALDVSILLAYVAYQVDKVVLRPLRNAVSAAEAIAHGDLARRLEPGETVESANLAESVNRMTDRLLEERAHLVRAEKMASVGRLAAGIAHEIGNPLGAINGYVHVLRKSAPQNAATTDALAGLERESARIDHIVRGLLDYARPGRRTPGCVDLNETARGVIDLLMAQGILRHVDLEFSPAATATHVTGERNDLEQTLVNLVLNAVDAMQGTGRLSLLIRRTTRDELLAGARRSSDPQDRAINRPSARVLRWLETVDAGEVAMIAVADSGPGVPEADADRVFDPFYTTKEPGKGTGLGLAIVARTVENGGGTVWVTSSREGGAAFRILLPIAPAGVAAA